MLGAEGSGSGLEAFNGGRKLMGIRSKETAGIIGVYYSSVRSDSWHRIWEVLICHGCKK